MMRRLSRALEILLGAPRTMKPEEVVDRIEALESKVESNRVALERHETDQQVHLQVESPSDQ